uniref:Uncharacterized protein n=1 Tax=Arundo donax TaxID=35708 RepID=A0A0A9A835_ARUDO
MATAGLTARSMLGLAAASASRGARIMRTATSKTAGVERLGSMTTQRAYPPPVSCACPPPVLPRRRSLHSKLL